MATRGRPPTLKNRKTTSVSLESWQDDYVKSRSIDLSKFVRDNLDALILAEKSTVEKLKHENEEYRKIIQDYEIKIRQNEAQIKELEEIQAMEIEEEKVFSELEEKRRTHLKEYERNVKRNDTCKKMWLDYLVEGLKFASYEEAKFYARTFWIEDGLDEATVLSFLKLD